MYSTKLLNKNIVDGNKYITIGDPYKDPLANTFRQDKKGDTSKSFICKMRPVNAENGNFSKITYAGTPYRETNMYLSTQPLDKRVKGFGSKDAHRRDEFTSAIRTEQYRESMRKELNMYKNRNQTQELPPIDDRASTAPASFGKRTEMLYDIGRTKVTEFDPKSTKDCFYRTTLEREKKLGPYRPTSTNIGDNAWKTEYKPPAHGAASLVKNFFDKSHLKVNST